MKKTQEILGLPIISISDGNEVGKVKGILINADKGAIDFFVVDSGVQAIGTRVIPTEDILGIGEYALTIEYEDIIRDISSIPPAVDLLQKDVKVKNTRVLTKKGRLIGETGDIYVDEDEFCNIAGVEFTSYVDQSGVRIIPRQNVITFGKNLIVVTEDVESALLDEMIQSGSLYSPVGVEKKNLGNFDLSDKPDDNAAAANEVADSNDIIAKADNILAAEGNEYYKELDVKAEGSESSQVLKETNAAVFTEVVETTQNKTEEVNIQSSAAPSEGGAGNLFEQRQRQYLKGRRVTKTITDNSGSVIISEGSVITDDVIDAAKTYGKLIELVMNNKA